MKKSTVISSFNIKHITQYVTTILIILALQSVCEAGESDITRRSLNISTDNSLDWKNTYENELKKLINRIEVLEHQVKSLKQQSIMGDEEEDSEVITTPKQNALSSKKNIDNQSPLEESIFALGENSKPEPKAVKENTADSKEKKLYELALASLKEKKYVDASKKFGEFIENYPNSSMSSNAYYWYAESFVKQDNHNKAAVNYLKGYKTFPKGEKAADSLLKLAYSLEKLGKKDEARKILVKLKEEFPKRSAAQIKAISDALVRLSTK